jgi:hypothetical protein
MAGEYLDVGSMDRLEEVMKVELVRLLPRHSVLP